MSDPAPDRTSAWSPIYWSDFPAPFHGRPDEWPRPERPSQSYVFWWRAALVIPLIFFPVYALAFPTAQPESTGLRLVSLWSAVPLSVVFGTAVFVVATRPYFKRPAQVDELMRHTRIARRETMRAIRRRQPVPADREPLVWLWIGWYRARTRFLGWIGLSITWQIVIHSDRASWPTAALLAIAVLWLVVSAERLRRERALRHWESTQRSVDGAG